MVWVLAQARSRFFKEVWLERSNVAVWRMLVVWKFQRKVKKKWVSGG